MEGVGNASMWDAIGVVAVYGSVFCVLVVLAGGICGVWEWLER